MKASIEDSIIVKKIIEKDEKTLVDFYKSYEQKLYRFIFAKVGDHDLTEEICQEAFVDFIESIPGFRFQCSLKTFLFAIAKNKTIDALRKKKLKKILFSALPSYIVEGLKTIVIDDEIDRNELSKKIENVFQILPHEYAVVLRLKYGDGEKVADIAKRLSMGFKATESLIFRARMAFIKLFDQMT